MATRVFLCPNAGQRVQVWFADSENCGDTYESVTCSTCGQVHMVNPKAGKVLGADKRPTTRGVTKESPGLLFPRL
jgi:hypothetical protein